MRITVLCNDLGIRLPGSKGASVHLRSITRAFARIGHQVQLVAVAGHEPLDPSLRDLLNDVVMFDHPGRSEGVERERRKLAHIEHMMEVAGPAIEAFAPEMIYERLSLFSDAGARLAGRLGTDLVVEVNAVMSAEEARWRGLHHVDLATTRERTTLDAAALRVGVSAEVAAQVDEVAPGGRTVVVANGVEVASFAEQVDRQVARQRFGLDPSVPVAVFVGALRPWHGVEGAIDALVRTTHPVHLLVVGDGEIAPDLRSRASALGLSDRVHLVGQLPHDEVALALAAADTAIAPYPQLEGFSFSPLKLYEYLAAGVPVIASDVGQVSDALAAGAFGTLVPAGDIAALANALDRIGSPESLERADAGRRFARAHHDWSARALEICDHLHPRTDTHALAR